MICVVSLYQTLADFISDVAQCENLIANAHKEDSAGRTIFPLLDRQQVTVAAFLNMFIAWEKFLEDSITNLMAGSPTIGGTAPIKYVSPLTTSAAREMVSGGNNYFDYAAHDKLKKIINLYFQNGYPFEPHIGSIYSDLSDMKTMRNAAAHRVSSTQIALESLAGRIFGQQKPGIDLYALLTSFHPQFTPPKSVFTFYKDKLVVVAELIANG